MVRGYAAAMHHRTVRRGRLSISVALALAAVLIPTASASASSVRPLGLGGPFGFVSDVSPSADGSRILITAQTDFSPDRPNPKRPCCVIFAPKYLWAANADGSSPIRLTAPGTEGEGGRITPDGTKALWGEVIPSYDPDIPQKVTYVRGTTDGTVRQAVPAGYLAPNGDLYIADDVSRGAQTNLPPRPRLRRIRWGSTAIETLWTLNPHRWRAAGQGASTSNGFTNPALKSCYAFTKRVTDVVTVDNFTGGLTHTQLPSTLKVGSDCFVTQAGRTILPAQRNNRSVIVVIDGGRYRVVPIAGARVTKQGEHITELNGIKPDGSQAIVTLYTGTTCERTHLAAVDLRSAQLRFIAAKSACSASGWTPGDWSPTGERLMLQNGGLTGVAAFWDARGFKMKVVKAPAALTKNGNDPSAYFSPDDSRLVFYRYPSRPAFGTSPTGSDPVNLGLLYRFITSADGSHSWALQAPPATYESPAPVPFWSLDPSDIGRTSDG